MTLSGLYVPLITPFDGGEVAVDALARLAHDVLSAGAAGVVALGTTAEPSSLRDAERRVVLDVVRQVCRERDADLVVGATPDVTGVTAALTLVPPFTRPGEAGVLAYFQDLTVRSRVPVVVYDVPRRTGQYLSADTLLRLAELPGVVGVKYAPGGINADTIRLLAEAPPNFAVLCGDDPFASALLALGARGAVLASAHVATADFARLITLWHQGEAVAARTLGARLGTLAMALFAEPNPTVIKAVLHAEGRIPSPDVRLPLLPAAPETTAVCREILGRSG
jgi:4-hydroxy-tetrahydrodipicolinate synthase